VNSHARAAGNAEPEDAALGDSGENGMSRQYLDETIFVVCRVYVKERERQGLGERLGEEECVHVHGTGLFSRHVRQAAMRR